MSPPSHVVSRAPVHVVVGLPHVGAAAAEAEGLEAHGLERDVAGEDHEVGPGDLAAVLLLDRPEQAARLVEADVVRPAVERREALLAAAAAAAAVADAVGAGAVPGHADEEATVVAEVGRPPVLRVGHQRVQVLLQGREVEALELLGVVEVRAHRVGLGRVLVQQVEPQGLGPPVAVRGAAAGGLMEGALGFGAHGRLRGVHRERARVSAIEPAVPSGGLAIRRIGKSSMRQEGACRSRKVVFPALGAWRGSRSPSKAHVHPASLAMADPPSRLAWRPGKVRW